MAKKIEIPRRLKSWRQRIERQLIKRKTGDHFTQEMAAKVLTTLIEERVPHGTYITYESGRRGVSSNGSLFGRMKKIADATERAKDDAVIVLVEGWPTEERFRHPQAA